MEEIRTEQQSGGIAIGKAVLLKQPDLAAERREITAAEAEKEQAAFRRAAEQVREALRPLARTNAIFAAHLDMAEDATRGSRRPPFGISPRRPFFLQRSSIPPIPLRWIFDTSEGW